MDLKGWKKIKEDGNSCTLSHPKGHTMTIAMKALPKIMREQIKRLEFAKGGEVPVSMPDPQKARDAWKGASEGQSLSAGWNNLKSEIGLGDSSKPSDQNQQSKNYAGSDDPADSVVSNDAQSLQGAVPNFVNPQQQIPIGIAAPRQPASAPIQEPAEETPTPNDNLLNNDQTVNVPAAVQLQQKAIEQQVPIDIQKAKAFDKNSQENIEAQRSIQQFNANNFKEIKGHADDFANYISANPINPKSYQENMSSGQKVSTAIGLFLGGLGTPFGGHNYAQDFLDKQIDRDVAAQEKRADLQKTVWGAYKDLYGDSVIATNMAKVAANDILVRKTEQEAARLGTPQAIQAANAMKASKAIDNHQLTVDSSGRLGTLRVGGGAPGQPGAKPSGQRGAANNMDDWYKDHILSPNATQISRGLKFNPLATPFLAGIEEQKAKADLSDKAIEAINQAFPSMSKTTGEASYAREHLEPFLNSVPFGIGAPVANAVHTFTDTGDTRDYETYKSQITGAVRGALQGNVSDDLLDSTVKANLPNRGDTPQRLANKMKTLKEFIRSHTKTDLLRQFNLSKE